MKIPYPTRKSASYRSDKPVAGVKFAHYGLEPARSTNVHLVTWVYAVGPLTGGLTKIGFSRNVTRRLAAIQSMSPVPVTLLWKVRGGRALEAQLHSIFAPNRIRGEWFDLGPDPVQTIEQAIRMQLPDWTLRSQAFKQLYHR